MLVVSVNHLHGGILRKEYILNHKNIFANAFNTALTLNLCILKVTDAIEFEFMMPLNH